MKFIRKIVFAIATKILLINHKIQTSFTPNLFK